MFLAANRCPLRLNMRRGSQEAELAQLAAQRLRHVPGARRGAIEIARRVLVREIAPALECPPRPRLDQDDPRLQDQMAAPDPFLVDEGPHFDQALTAHDLAPNHPVERAVAQLVGALGDHSRPMQMLAREPALLALLEPLANPILEITDRVAADTEFNEMKCHDGYCEPVASSGA